MKKKFQHFRYKTTAGTTERQLEILDLQMYCPVCQSPGVDARDTGTGFWSNEYQCGSAIHLLSGYKLVAAKPCPEAMNRAVAGLQKLAGVR